MRNKELERGRGREKESDREGGGREREMVRNSERERESDKELDEERIYSSTFSQYHCSLWKSLDDHSLISQRMTQSIFFSSVSPL
jgi:hypothetical protein